jgi:hypothetical protein
VATWSLAHGLRGAVWHQLHDADADELTHLRTFGVAHPLLARRLVTHALFPLELAALAALLWRVDSALAVAFLLIAALLDLLRRRVWRLRIRVVTWGPMSRHAMHEYYVVFYPAGFLAAATLRDPTVALLLVGHCLVFPRSLIVMVRDARSLAGQLARSAFPPLRSAA